MPLQSTLDREYRKGEQKNTYKSVLGALIGPYIRRPTFKTRKPAASVTSSELLWPYSRLGKGVLFFIILLFDHPPQPRATPIRFFGILPPTLGLFVVRMDFPIFMYVCYSRACCFPAICVSFSGFNIDEASLEFRRFCGVLFFFLYLVLVLAMAPVPPRNQMGVIIVSEEKITFFSPNEIPGC
ncbi:hypothetical protein CDAR_321571 [Caerostris darwini]|uniref:Uncharacterized protein n=1 Tax=Caerostris darwini TaxID=1538125 RepID=A0AAV4NVS6_9ARAC|nr:hypothetical protein CDAR_321571 [Caerostris darwini]